MIKNLVKIVGENNVITDEVERLCYSRDMSLHEGSPDAIVFPNSTENIVKILKLANKLKIPVVPRGAGTSVVGSVIAPRGGIILDFTFMNKIIELSPADLYVTVEPGVVYAQLDTELKKYNLFFPPDPGSSMVCTIGGMLGMNASGLHAAKYGTTKDYVLGLEVVLPNGRVITTGSKSAKSVTGYDLTRLFIGSEGTLGVISRATLKIIPRPQYVVSAMAVFKNLVHAGNAISQIFASGIIPAVIEILDRICIQVINNATGIDLPEVEGIILFETDGHKESAIADMTKIVEICKQNRCIDVKVSDAIEERNKMWFGRKVLISALSRMKTGWRVISIGEDIGVPSSKIPICIRKIQKISRKYGIIIATFGHVGDGNLHPVMLVDVRNKSHWTKIDAVAKELITVALDVGGTLTTEHGIGFSKSTYMKLELGTSFAIIKNIKNVIDPNNILNPGVMGIDKRTRVLDYFAFSDLVKGRTKLPIPIENEIVKCIMCGFCRAYCPIFDVLKLESYNARGKVLLAYSLHTKVDNLSDIADRFYKCTTCGICNQTCPAGVDVMLIVDYVRTHLVANGIVNEKHAKIKDNIVTTYNPFGENTKPRIALKKYINRIK
jgi:glycolate oxidase